MKIVSTKSIDTHANSIKASKRHVAAGHQSQVDTMPISSLGLNHSFIVFNYVQGSVGDITPKRVLSLNEFIPNS